MLTIFYDGNCPLCQMEMRKLAQLDQHGKLHFEDIQQSDFKQRFPDLNWANLNARIHVMQSDGVIVTGLDATYLAWKAVGKGWVYAPTRWPVIRWFADLCYRFFAKYRLQLSFILTGKKRCEACDIQSKSCSIATSAKDKHHVS